MYRIVLMYIVVVNLFTNAAIAQNLSITSHAGYVFDDHISSGFDEFSGRVKGGLQWGIGIQYSQQPSFGLELLYLRQDTKSLIRLTGEDYRAYNLDINYVLLTGTNYFNLRSKVNPYAGSLVGMAIMRLQDTASDKTFNRVKFTWGIKAGLRFSLSKRIDFRLQGLLMATIQAVGGKFYFGSSGVGYSTLLQFNAGGGLVIRLGAARHSTSDEDNQGN